MAAELEQQKNKYINNIHQSAAMCCMSACLWILKNIHYLKQDDCSSSHGWCTNNNNNKKNEMSVDKFIANMYVSEIFQFASFRGDKLSGRVNALRPIWTFSMCVTVYTIQNTFIQNCFASYVISTCCIAYHSHQAVRDCNILLQATFTFWFGSILNRPSHIFLRAYGFIVLLFVCALFRFSDRILIK